jgi:hypothetical protein
VCDCGGVGLSTTASAECDRVLTALGASTRRVPYHVVKQVSSPFAARHAWTYERRCLKLLGHSGEKGVLQGRITVH